MGYTSKNKIWISRDFTTRKIIASVYDDELDTHEQKQFEFDEIEDAFDWAEGKFRQITM